MRATAFEAIAGAELRCGCQIFHCDEDGARGQASPYRERHKWEHALLSATPPLAVRLNLHSDVLEESALRQQLLLAKQQQLQVKLFSI